mmetsp:Transcript_100865/g.216239  ORF Transcript_100865/g.216239 Transcript_100865/m.216239 type:complete len:436 (-) Transcript_100865:1035-2342(-)
MTIIFGHAHIGDPRLSRVYRPALPLAPSFSNTFCMKRKNAGKSSCLLPWASTSLTSFQRTPVGVPVPSSLPRLSRMVSSSSMSSVPDLSLSNMLKTCRNSLTSVGVKLVVSAASFSRLNSSAVEPYRNILIIFRNSSKSILPSPSLSALSSIFLAFLCSSRFSKAAGNNSVSKPATFAFSMTPVLSGSYCANMALKRVTSASWKHWFFLVFSKSSARTRDTHFMKYQRSMQPPAGTASCAATICSCVGTSLKVKRNALPKLSADMTPVPLSCKAKVFRMLAASLSRNVDTKDTNISLSISPVPSRSYSSSTSRTALKPTGYPIHRTTTSNSEASILPEPSTSNSAKAFATSSSSERRKSLCSPSCMTRRVTSSKLSSFRPESPTASITSDIRSGVAAGCPSSNRKRGRSPEPRRFRLATSRCLKRSYMRASSRSK